MTEIKHLNDFEKKTNEVILLLMEINKDAKILIDQKSYHHLSANLKQERLVSKLEQYKSYILETITTYENFYSENR